MSIDKQLKKIEKALTKILETQEELGARIDALEFQNATHEDVAPAADVIRFLDRFRAGEALGEALFGAWIEACQDDELRGGLRTIQQREGMHARLLEERIKSLGGSLSAEVPARIFDATMADAGSREKGDARKLRDFMARIPDIDAAVAPIGKMVARLGDDYETRGLLETICQDERSTLEYLGRICAERNA